MGEDHTSLPQAAPWSPAAPSGGRAGLTKADVAAAAVPIAAVVLVVNLAVRAGALKLLQIPAAALPLPPLVMASIGATLGPAFGCYMAFREPSLQSMTKFLLPGAALTVMGMGVEVARFAFGHGHRGALVVGLSQGLVAMIFVLPVLLRRVARTRVLGRRV